MASSEARLYTIPLWRPFAHDLAAGLLARFPDPLDLARVMVVVPSRRAVRTLTEAFVALADGQALLLPRMAPAGDMDADEALGAFVDALDGPPELLAEAPPLARRLILARILGNARKLTATEALALADQLGAALDTLQIEGRHMAEIDGSVPPESADHWEQNRLILQQLEGAWPDILAARGWMDAAARRNRLLHLLARRWGQVAPPFPVVMAGFASAPPAVAELAGVVARLPAGMLVLPGLDLGLAAASRDAVAGETHPQFGMLRLLQTARLSAGEAVEWPWQAPVAASTPQRADLARTIMLPAGTDAGPLAPIPASALAGIRMVETAGTAEEALLIAIAMRQIVDHPGRRAALVTPDRMLAKRVQVQLRRFGIEVDDSAGLPLDKSPPGSLLVQLAAAAAEQFAPVALLGLLLHPLVRAGEGRLAWLNRVRQLDRLALRGLRPRAGLAGITERLADAPPDLHSWWAEEAAPLLLPLETLPRDANALFRLLCAVAEQLACTNLWSGEAGKALGALAERLDLHSEDLAGLTIEPAEAATFTASLIGQETVRPRWGKHPQLAIWGPLEARLQHADLIVLGGLNEGNWPGGMAADTFLPPAIRRTLGLPGLERRTGLQAHDFVAALGAPELLITRAARQDGAPQVASRFWQRMVAVCGVTPDHDGLIASGAALVAAARGLMQQREVIRIAQPQPAPPAAARPRRISITEVAMLKADPFSFYARHMLKLAPLDPRDAEPTGGERGQIVHNILEKWFNNQRQDIDTLINSHLLDLGDRPEIAALWRPRVRRMVDFAIDNFDPAAWQFVQAEASGAVDVRGVRLKGRADRVDCDTEGRLRIVDYKTGALPKVRDVQACWETQLALLGGLAARGCLQGVSPAPVASLQYLHLGGGTTSGATREALGNSATTEGIASHLHAAWDDMEELVAGYLLGERPFVAKLQLVRGRRWRDYDLLARVAEWLGR